MEGALLKILWIHMVGLRFMLCLLPQYGYIFPDEFFQSPEIMAGDVFGFSHHRTWEWNTTKPARSIVFPILSSGLPFVALKHFSDYTEYAIDGYSLILAPRVWMTFLSIFIDIFIYKIAYRIYCDDNLATAAILIFASSYTSWIYCTRTFSNMTELLFLAVILYCVMPAKANSPKTNTSKEETHKKDKESSSKVEDIDSPSEQQSCGISKATVISSVVVAGFFIRTSFIGFALAPVLFWIFKDFTKSNITHSIQLVLKNIISLIPGGFFTAAFLLLCDTAYFDYEKVQELSTLWQEFSISRIFNWMKSLPLTPFNILQYNLDNSNLEKHGLHPWFTHSAVNLPLLFGPLLIPFIKEVIEIYFHPQKNARMKASKSGYNLLVSTFACGLFLLSCIPHQEPRYILPLAVPAVIMSVKRVYPWTSHKIFFVFWVIFNCGFSIFFGILHQGGIVPCMDYVHVLAKTHREMKLNNPSQRMNVIFYKTYMPPIHLAAWPAEDPLLNIVDLAGSSHAALETSLNDTLMLPNSHTYLVTPASLPCAQTEQLARLYNLDLQYQFFPHLSTETFSWSDPGCDDSDTTVLDALDRMSLNIHNVEPLNILQQIAESGKGAEILDHTLHKSAHVKTSTQ